MNLNLMDSLNHLVLCIVMKTKSFKKALELSKSYSLDSDLFWHLRVSVDGLRHTYWNTPLQVHQNLLRSNWKFIWLEYYF